MWASNVKELDRPPAPDGSAWASGEIGLAERRTRALAPTIYCPESRVDECISEAEARVST